MKRDIVGQLLGALAGACIVGCGAPPETDVVAVQPTGTTTASSDQVSSTAPVQPTGSTTTTGATTGTTGCVKEAGSNMLVSLSDANNYSFTNMLMVQTTAVKPSSFLTVDWSGLTQDFLQQPLDPMTGVDMISVVLWELTTEQVIEDLNNDALGDRGVSGGIFKPTNNSVTNLSTQGMIIKGNTMAETDENLMKGFDVAQLPPEQYTYTFMVNDGLNVGEGVKMIHAVKLDPASENTTVTITNDSTVINYTADLHTKPALTLPANNNAIFLDWTGMTTNALGRAFTPRQVGEVRVVHVPKTPAEIESGFLGLETMGDKTYTGEVCEDGKMALSSLKDETGAAFPGIDPAQGGTWLVALMCMKSKCGNPAPWYMARVEATP